MSEQKDFLDYNKVGDTGADNVDSISPVGDGEGATQSTFRRPSENLRTRTEDIRQGFEDLFYYRDVQLIYRSGGFISWDAGTGIVSQAANITIRPMLVPATNTKGSLSIGGATIDQVIYAVNPAAGAAYSTEGMNQITVEHRDTGYVGAVPDVVISDGPIKRITVFFDSGNTAHDSAATKTQVDSAIAGDPDLSGKIIVTDNGSVANTIADSTGEIAMQGTYEAEEHLLLTDLIGDFTAINPLGDGDTLAIWYKHLVEPAGGDASDPKGGLEAGGRRESGGAGTSTIPSASLFITTSEPAKIPGAIPICTVEGTDLIFGDGTVFADGASSLLGGGSSAFSSYAGGPNWADGTTNPATTVEAQLDKNISDLAGAAGTAKIGGAAYVATPDVGADLALGRLDEQLESLADQSAERARTTTGNNFTGDNIFVSDTGSGTAGTFTGGAPNGRAITALGLGSSEGINSTGGTSNGAGVVGYGGTNSGPGLGGFGAISTSAATSGAGAILTGGANSTGGTGGPGFTAVGGVGDDPVAAMGGAVTGADAGAAAGTGGQGLVATGGDGLTTGDGGPGILATGGVAPDTGDGGAGIQADGGTSSSGDPGYGILATGGGGAAVSVSAIGAGGVFVAGGTNGAAGIIAEGNSGGSGDGTGVAGYSHGLGNGVLGFTVAGTGAAIRGDSSSGDGYAGSFKADIGGTPVRATLNLAPQGGIPSTPSEGDFTYAPLSGDHSLWVYQSYPNNSPEWQTIVTERHPQSVRVFGEADVTSDVLTGSGGGFGMTLSRPTDFEIRFTFQTTLFASGDDYTVVASTVMATAGYTAQVVAKNAGNFGVSIVYNDGTPAFVDTSVQDVKISVAVLGLITA